MPARRVQHWERAWDDSAALQKYLQGRTSLPGLRRVARSARVALPLSADAIADLAILEAGALNEGGAGLPPRRMILKWVADARAQHATIDEATPVGEKGPAREKGPVGEEGPAGDPGITLHDIQTMMNDLGARMDKKLDEIAKDVKEELADVRKELVDFKKELVDFKKELVDFKKELVDFKKELVDFKKELVDFKKESAEQFQKLEHGQVIASCRLLNSVLVFLGKPLAAVGPSLPLITTWAELDALGKDDVRARIAVFGVSDELAELSPDDLKAVLWALHGLPVLKTTSTTTAFPRS